MLYTLVISTIPRQKEGVLLRVSKNPHERRAELVEAARRLFDARGVDNTRISDIVAEVGVAQGVFYYYFKSKDEMVEVVTGQVTGEVRERADGLLADSALSFCQKLAGMIELYIDLVDQFLGDEETRIALPRGDSLPDILGGEAAGAIGQARALLNERLAALVRAGAEAGEVTAAFPEESAAVLLWGLHALATRSLPGREVIYAVAEQGLGIAKGGLTALAG